MSDPQPASAHLEAVIDLPEGGGARVAALAGQVLSAVIGDLTGTRGDVVVRRVEGHDEVLRIDAGADEEPAAVLAQVRADLDALDEAAFVEKWSAVDQD